MQCACEELRLRTVICRRFAHFKHYLQYVFRRKIMRMRRITVLLLSGLFLITTMAAMSQNASSKPVRSSTSTPVMLPGPTNLKVLPKDTSLEDINKLMLRFTTELGVTCTHCHEQNEQTKQMEFASDGNPMKATARLMISMTNDINNKYLAQLGDRRYAQPITCGNCHQGQTMPPSFEK
jgi:hypothetical protein